MADTFSPEKRSWLMGRVHAENTQPEIAVRRIIHALGYRFRLHRRDLPGVPDIVFPGRRKVIFVHGCFWHQHPCKRGHRIPTSHQDYWIPKLARNVDRDRKNRRRLRTMGWKTLVIWECQIRAFRVDRLGERISAFLESE